MFWFIMSKRRNDDNGDDDDMDGNEDSRGAGDAEKKLQADPPCGLDRLGQYMRELSDAGKLTEDHVKARILQNHFPPGYQLLKGQWAGFMSQMSTKFPRFWREMKGLPEDNKTLVQENDDDDNSGVSVSGGRNNNSGSKKSGNKDKDSDGAGDRKIVFIGRNNKPVYQDDHGYYQDSNSSSRPYVGYIPDRLEISRYHLPGPGRRSDGGGNRNVLIPLFHNVSGVPVFEDVQPGKFFTGGVGQAKRSYYPTHGEWQMLYQRGYNPRSGDFYDEPDYDYEYSDDYGYPDDPYDDSWDDGDQDWGYPYDATESENDYARFGWPDQSSNRDRDRGSRSSSSTSSSSSSSSSSQTSSSPTLGSQMDYIPLNDIVVASPAVASPPVAEDYFVDPCYDHDYIPYYDDCADDDYYDPREMDEDYMPVMEYADDALEKNVSGENLGHSTHLDPSGSGDGKPPDLLPQGDGISHSKVRRVHPADLSLDDFVDSRKVALIKTAEKEPQKYAPHYQLACVFLQRLFGNYKTFDANSTRMGLTRRNRLGRMAMRLPKIFPTAALFRSQFHGRNSPPDLRNKERFILKLQSLLRDASILNAQTIALILGGEATRRDALAMAGNAQQLIYEGLGQVKEEYQFALDPKTARLLHQDSDDRIAGPWSDTDRQKIKQRADDNKNRRDMQRDAEAGNKRGRYDPNYDRSDANRYNPPYQGQGYGSQNRPFFRGSPYRGQGNYWNRGGRGNYPPNRGGGYYRGGNLSGRGGRANRGRARARGGRGAPP